MPILRGGIIGMRGHAARIINILKSKEHVRLDKIYLNRDDSNPKVTRNLKDLLSLDFIILASPTPYHAEQLKILENFKGHIFCEKPISIRKEYLDRLRNGWFDGRFYTNYCFHCSPVGLLFSDYLDSNNHEIVDFNFVFSHSGAYHFPDSSWRFQLEGGVLNTSLSHFMHYLLVMDKSFCFSKPDKHSLTKKGLDFTKILVSNQTGGGKILSSWALPEMAEINFLCAGGIIKWDGQTIYTNNVITANRKTDKKLRCVNKKINIKDNFNASLDKSLDIFLEGVLKGQQNPFLHEASLLVEDYLIKYS